MIANALRAVGLMLWEIVRTILMAAAQGVSVLIRKAAPVIILGLVGIWILQNHPGIISVVAIFVILVGAFRLVLRPVLPKKWR